MAWARKEGISNVRFETLPPYVDPQGRRYQRIRVSGTKGFSLDGQDHITFNGPASYHRAGVDPTSSIAVDSTICRNKDGDVIAVPRQTREALSSATASLIEGSEHGQKVSYAVIIFVVPGPDDLVITGALATSVGKRLTAAGYEVVSDGIRMIIKKGGSEVSGESAEAARKIVTDAITDEASETARCARQKGDRMTSQDDPLSQLSEIENAQRAVRQGKSKQIIDSIEKSRQRAKNRLKDIANDPDLMDDLE